MLIRISAKQNSGEFTSNVFVLLKVTSTLYSPFIFVNSENLPKSLAGRGKKMVTTICLLISDSKNWFEIVDESYYHFPRVFKSPHPKRLGYCTDISTLSQHNSHKQTVGDGSQALLKDNMLLTTKACTITPSLLQNFFKSGH